MILQIYLPFYNLPQTFNQAKPTFSDKFFVIQKKLNYNMRYLPFLIQRCTTKYNSVLYTVGDLKVDFLI